MTRREIHCFSAFKSTALAMDDSDFGRRQMAEFRRFCPALFIEYRKRFLNEETEREAKGKPHRPSIFDTGKEENSRDS